MVSQFVEIRYRMKRDAVTKFSISQRNTNISVSKFGTEKDDDLSDTDDEASGLGLYCPHCYEYMSNPWTLSCKHTLCQRCLLKQVSILWASIS